MKDHEVANMLAVLADAEMRSTALLVEVIAAATVFKLAPPEGDTAVQVEISQADLLEAAQTFFWKADYDEHGTMRIRVSRSAVNLVLDQPEVTSEQQ